MGIEYIKGDLFSAPQKYILHGCNAQGVMGSGVAAVIHKDFPLAYKAYRDEWLQSHELRLGDIIPVDCGDRTIINAILQQYYGRDGKRYVSYDAVALAMEKVEYQFSGKEIAMPMIGAGLGGGDWNVIESIIESELHTVKPYVYQL